MEPNEYSCECFERQIVTALAALDLAAVAELAHRLSAQCVYPSAERVELLKDIWRLESLTSCCKKSSTAWNHAISTFAVFGMNEHLAHEETKRKVRDFKIEKGQRIELSESMTLSRRGSVDQDHVQQASRALSSMLDGP
ncbi:hypothetical protein [Pseudomonas sp. NPDC086251]|uniref:hypothetical protein n=1 Tax=Pseudomonas sp. NPDC086251 TaxID=3364431 RepID=UPI003837A8E9